MRITGFVARALCVATILHAPHADAQSVSAPRAITAAGTVQGLTLTSGVRAFRGIPFAAPDRKSVV